MRSRWVPFLKPRSQPREARFKHTLIRNVVLILLLTTLLPILLIGTLNVSRTRDLLKLQSYSQLKNITDHQVNQINDYVKAHDTVISRLVTDQSFNEALSRLLDSPEGSAERQQASNTIKDLFRNKPRTAAYEYYDNLMILSPEGSLMMATDDVWVKGFGSGAVTNLNVLGLIGTNRSTFVFSPAAFYMNRLALLTSRSFVAADGKQRATLIGISTSKDTQSLLADSSSFLPEAQSYYFTSKGEVAGVKFGGSLQKMVDSPELNKNLGLILGDTRKSLEFSARVFEKNTQVFAVAQWLPEYNLGVVLTVPEAVVFAQSDFLGTFTIAIVLGSLLLSTVLIYYSTTQMVNPLVHLANSAERFIKGEWSERATIKRDDEIGLLANSFNSMASQLAELHQSVDSVVEQRTRQIRVASEVAQLATSSARLSDALGRTVALIAERFGFYHVAIYLLDTTGQTLELREAAGLSSDLLKKRGDRAEKSPDNLLGWVASNGQSRLILDVQNDALFRAQALLPDTRSEMAVPITVGDEILGVLDIQSTLIDTFDQETVSIFQTLANQISNTLQNTRLLEATQVTYQETALLYRATRQVTQARNETEIIQILSDTFVQLPIIGAVLSIEGENFKIMVVTDSKGSRVERNLITLNIPTGQIAQLLTENRVVMIEDINQPNEYDNLISFLLRRGCKAAALVSVLENGHLSKVLALGSREKNQITSNSLQPYLNLAEVIGASAEKYHVLNALEQRLSELQILASFGQAITAETNLNQLYRVVHEQVNQVLGAEVEFTIALYDARQNEIQFPYSFEKGQLLQVQPFTMGEGLTSQLIQSRKPLLLKNERDLTKYQGKVVGQSGARSWLGVPLIFAGEVVGAIILQDLIHENRFDQDDANLFMTLAPQIATAVRNAQLYAETQGALHAYDQEHFLINTLLDHMPEGISFKDPRGKYIRASTSVAKLFQLDADMVIGKTDFDLLERDIAERIYRDEQRVMNLGKPEIGLVQPLVSKEGLESWSDTSRIPIRTASGDPYGLLVIQRDITELKQAEALAQRRANQVLTAAEIARDATGTLDVKILLQKMVNLVHDRFGFYHASIFLLDAANEYAVLRESTGQAGQKMLQDGHRLAVRSKSIVGQAAATGQALLVNDITVDPTHLVNPLLPDTRSELAIPLKTGNRVLGALDVQSTKINAFNNEDVKVLEILADQMAVALVNSELFAKTEELLNKHRLLRQITVAASASASLDDTLLSVVNGLRNAQIGERIAILMLNEDQLLQVRISAGYEGVQHLEVRIALGQGITGQAAVEKKAIRVHDTLGDSRYINVDSSIRSELAIPMLFGEELIGVLDLESTRPAAFDENDQEILSALGNNLGGVIANMRLVNQVRQQVTRERQLFDTTSKIRRTVDLETILETSAREIARALGARRARIQITAGKAGLLNELSQTTLDGAPNGSNGNGKTPSNGNGNGHDRTEE